MSVLVIGTGFIGCALAERLSSMGAKTYLFGSTPIRKQSQLGRMTHLQGRLPSAEFSNALVEIKPEDVVFCAGLSDISLSFKNQFEDYYQCAAMTTYVVTELARLGIGSRVIFLSSAAVYSPVASESDIINENSRIGPVSPYGCSRYLGEEALRLYCRQNQLGYCITRIFSCYGIGLEKRVIWDFCKQLSQYGQIHSQSPAGVRRDYLHIEDLAKALSTIILSKTKYSTINVASGTSVLISDIATVLTERYRQHGTTAQPIFSNSQPSGNPMFWRADTSLLKSIGFEPSVRMDEGLAEYADWAFERLKNGE